MALACTIELFTKQFPVASNSGSKTTKMFGGTTF